ncbi:hypothetical protein FA13DRAFT_1731067 [Coprinellus micaceus]|uniref:Afadin and alpha-actinin-binding-domain-containing protein n=1 Tax=Coprinellus micaceus TaxID=71717 RepID=A0A4Y7TH56_COPMI|nr:hypothetical protein FA13DRAFT_1731067 [Coprinellus micaceus]
MAATPKRSVHWNYEDMSFSELSSPGSTGSESFASTSSLEYANAQLLAHGYIDKAGLCLDGVSNVDSEAVVRCLLRLLGDRMADMARTEELTTKIRTMTYENERLSSMHRSALEQGANAEREANLHKSKLTAAQRSLQSSETAHKQTTVELQRTRTSLQAIRSTHQAELKKREKEVERLTEKWQKIADLQAKLSTQPSGMTCANVAPVEGRRLDLAPSLEAVALEEAEKAREALLEDNQYLKALFLKAVNSIQRILYQTKCLLLDSTSEPEPISFTVATPHPADKLSSILTGLRTSLETASERMVNPEAKEVQQARAMNGEVKRLQTIIENLEDELDRCHNQLEGQAQEIQTMFEQFAEQQQTSAKELGDMSMEMMAADGRDEEKERLERIREELESERQKFSEAAVKFKNEKANLEAERIKFLDEKRSWEMDKVLANLGTTPTEEPHIPAVRHAKLYKQSPRKAAFKSPKKLVPKKSPAKMKPLKPARDSRKALGSPKKVIPAGETEILPPLPTLTFSRLGELPPPSSLLSSAFVLPPPSPHASLPSNPALPPPKPITPPDFGVAKDGDPTTSTPAPRPFPVAKPFAQRMPSPHPTLDSSQKEEVYRQKISFHSPEPAMTLAQELGITESPPETPLQEKKSVPNLVPNKSNGPTTGKGRVLFPDPNAKKPAAKPSAVATTGMSAREKGKMRAAEASAARAGAKMAGGARPVRAALGSGEKENSGNTAPLKVSSVFKAPPPPGAASATTKKGPSPMSSTAAPGSGKPARPPSASSKPIRPPSSRTSMAGGKSTTGGPRRVPIDSEEAPPVAKTRRV